MTAEKIKALAILCGAIATVLTAAGSLVVSLQGKAHVKGVERFLEHDRGAEYFKEASQ